MTCDFCTISLYFSYALSSFAALCAILKIWKIVNVHVLSQFAGNAVDLVKLGSYAIVTGATDGIGKAYAEELAKLGINICLISRSDEKLKEVSSQIEAKFNVKTKTIAIDFSQTDDIYTRIKEELKSLDVGVLVNNVGMGASPYPEYFLEVPNIESAYKKLVNVNVLSIPEMCRLVMPQMISKRKGVIINISSASALFAAPLMGSYAATKIYGKYLSQSLDFEYRSKGIIVQCVLPFFVATKMSKMREGFLSPSPTSYVKAALRTVGRESITHGCLLHAVQGAVVDLMLFFLPLPLIMSITLKVLAPAREKALRKMQRQAAANKDQ